MRRLIMLTLLAGLLIVGYVIAESYPPSPSSGKLGAPNQQHTQDKQQPSNEPKDLHPPIKTSCCQVCQVKEQTKTDKINNCSSYERWIIPFLTLVLVAIGAIQAAIYWGQLQHFRRTDRAYVKVKARKPGLEFTDSKEFIGMPEAVCNLEIMNYGTTPAHITDVVSLYSIVASGQQLPSEPEYNIPDSHIAAIAFLVKGESFFNFVGEDLNTIERSLAALESGKSILYLYGFVDYIDIFGQRHRGGFGFKYSPHIDKDAEEHSKQAFENRHNLLNMARDKYNYDHIRKKGEGIDWQ